MSSSAAEWAESPSFSKPIEINPNWMKETRNASNNSSGSKRLNGMARKTDNELNREHKQAGDPRQLRQRLALVSDRQTILIRPVRRPADPRRAMPPILDQPMDALASTP
jgi:hypothetical protein